MVQGDHRGAAAFTGIAQHFGNIVDSSTLATTNLRRNCRESPTIMNYGKVWSESDPLSPHAFTTPLGDQMGSNSDCDVFREIDIEINPDKSRALDQDLDNDLCVVLESVPPYKICSVNQKFLLQLGFREADMIGRTLRIVYGPRTDVKKILSMVENTVAGKGQAGEDVVLYSKDACEFSVQANSRIIMASEICTGRSACVLHFRMKEAESETAVCGAHQSTRIAGCDLTRESASSGASPARHTRSRHRYSNLYSPFRSLSRHSTMPPIQEQAPAVVLRAAPPHLIVDANSGFHHLFGFRNGELGGASARLLHGPAADPAALASLLRRAAAAGTDGDESTEQDAPARRDPEDGGARRGSDDGPSGAQRGWGAGEEEEEAEDDGGEEGRLTLYRKDGEPLQCRCRARAAPGDARELLVTVCEVGSEDAAAEFTARRSLAAAARGSGRRRRTRSSTSRRRAGAGGWLAAGGT